MKKVIVLLAVLVLASVAGAAPVLTNATLACPTCVANVNFNAAGGYITLQSGDSTSITDWLIGGDAITWNAEYTSGTYGWQSADGLGSSVGLNVMDPNGATNVGTIKQTIDGLTVGDLYTLSFWMSGAPGGKGQNSSGTYPNGFVQVNVEVTDLPAQIFTYAYQANNTRANMNWVKENYTFTAADTSEVITFESATTGTYFGPALDNIRFDQGGVPEPGTFSLLVGAGFLALAFLKYRK
jgi:hypothetical protein